MIIFPQVTTWIDPRTGRPSDPVRPDPSSLSHFMFESPPSPQSLMDVITVGSPVAVDISGKILKSILEIILKLLDCALLKVSQNN